MDWVGAEGPLVPLLSNSEPDPSVFRGFCLSSEHPGNPQITEPEMGRAARKGGAHGAGACWCGAVRGSWLPAGSPREAGMAAGECRIGTQVPPMPRLPPTLLILPGQVHGSRARWRPDRPEGASLAGSCGSVLVLSPADWSSCSGLTPQNHLYNISRSSFRFLSMLQRKRGKRLKALA